MRIVAATNLACPIDGLPLAASGAGLRCARGHAFDRAREGYCNLLLVQHKASLDPGDSRGMVAARRRFLEAGHYAPIADGLFVALRELAGEAAGGGATTVVDAGCGEGYYLERLGQLASACPDPGELRLAGFDVSKWAVRAACRRPTPVTWLVANSRRPPFAEQSVDILLCLFGFPVWEGFRGVQKAGGSVLLVDPGPEHLIELREIIYPSVARSAPPPLTRAEAAAYRLECSETVRFAIELVGRPTIQDLVAMTPHAFRLTAEGRDALARVEQLRVTVDVAIRLLRLG